MNGYTGLYGRNRLSNQVILFKSLIANTAGFLLWLSITSIMIEVFKVALSAMAIILSMDMIIQQWKK